MIKLLIASAAFLAISTGARATVQPPESGSYGAEVVVVSTNGGANCIDGAEEAFAGQVSYAGLDGKIDYIRVPLPSGDSGVVMSIQTLTVTSGSGTTHPSGSFTWVGTTTTGDAWNTHGTFSATITEIGTHAFIVTTQESYGDCSETDQLALARMSSDQ